MDVVNVHEQFDLHHDLVDVELLDAALHGDDDSYVLCVVPYALGKTHKNSLIGTSSCII